MAQRVNVLLVDDIDGSDAAETIPFGLDGTRYEIDLNSGHAHELREALEPFVKAARRVSVPAGRRPEPQEQRRQEQGDTRLGQGKGPGRQRPGPDPCRRSWRSTKRRPGNRRRPSYSEPGCQRASGTSPAARTRRRLTFPSAGSKFPSTPQEKTRTASRIPNLTVRVSRLRGGGYSASSLAATRGTRTRAGLHALMPKADQ